MSRNLGIGFAAVALLSACASQQPVTSSTTGTIIVHNGQVTEVRDISVRGGGRNTGIGSIAGAIIGGLAGSTIGSGTGSTVASIGGAVAGSMAGQSVEQSSATSNRTELTVRLENGSMSTYQVAASENFRVGDAVKVTTANGVTTVTR